MSIRKKISNYLYSNNQLGLVCILLLLILCFLPFSIYAYVFSDTVTTNDVNRYTKFSAIFTVIGVIATCLNAVIVIALMVWLHKKESRINLIPQINHLVTQLINIESIVYSEINYFHNRKDQTYENIESQSYDNDPYPFQHNDIYEKEIENIDNIIASINDFYCLFVKFKNDVSKNLNIDLNDYQIYLANINKLNEILTLKKPSVLYKTALIDRAREQMHEEEVINEALSDALDSITKMVSILNKSP